MTGVADAAAVLPPPRRPVRPSWSYETVAKQEYQDSGGVTERNVLDSPRTRRKSRRLIEAADNEMAPQGLPRQATKTGNALGLDMKAVPGSHVIQTEPVVQQLRKNDIRSTTRNRLDRNNDAWEKQGVWLGEHLKQPMPSSGLMLDRGQQGQHALLPGGHPPGPEIETGPELPPKGTCECVSSSLPEARAPEKSKELASQAGSPQMDKAEAGPQTPSPDHPFPALLADSLLSPDWAQTAKSSGVDPTQSSQETRPDLWAIKKTSAVGSDLNLGQSTYKGRSLDQETPIERTTSSINDHQPHQSMTSNESTSTSPDIAITAKSPMVCIHTKPLRLNGLRNFQFRHIGQSLLRDP
jgi:hypothetical protein